MERLRQILEYTRAHMGNLTPTQKLLVGSAVIIMAMSLFLVSQYAGKSDYQTIPVNPNSVASAIENLRNAGINAQFNGSVIQVREADVDRAIGVVTEAGDAGGNALDELLAEINNGPWWAPDSQNQQARNIAYSSALQKVIQNWSFVAKVEVFLAVGQKRVALGKPQSPSTAAVSIKSRSGSPLNDDQVLAVADFVAGVVPGMLAGNVKVIDSVSGRSLRVKDPSSFSASTYAELQSKMESLYKGKIHDLLQHIPGVIVAVNAQIDIKQETISDLEYKKDGGGTLIAPESEKINATKTTDSTSGGVPGVQPNTGASIQANSGGTNGSSSDDSDTRFTTFPGKTTKQTVDPKGYAKKLTASIVVPRSHYVRVWQQENPDSTDPPISTDLVPTIDSENQKIIAMTSPLLDTSVNGDSAVIGGGAISLVSVQMANDFGGVGGGGIGGLGGADSATSGGFMSLVTGNNANSSIKTLAMTGLAVFSLFLMFRLIRGAASRRDLPTAEELVGIPPSLATSDDDEIIGTASGSEPAMDALEIDEDELRARNLLEQVGEMVQTSPEESSKLLEKWVTAD